MIFRKLKPTPQLKEELIELYINKKLSSKHIAKMYNIGGEAIRKRLSYFNIPIRTTSEANYARFENSTQEERNEIVRKANIAMRGSKVKHETKIKIAKARENKLNQMSKHEKVFYDTIPQSIKEQLIFNYALDKFNIDFAAPRLKLAIEIHGGNWHNGHKRKIKQDKEKHKHLSKNNWNLIVIWSKDLEIGINNVISLFNTSSPNPTPIS